jgi:hypothetical protein
MEYVEVRLNVLIHEFVLSDIHCVLIILVYEEDTKIAGLSVIAALSYSVLITHVLAL